jgi:GR25 family glycosyltransferase involved in LPS biosynthesis
MTAGGPYVACINLYERSDRYEHMVREFRRFGREGAIKVGDRELTISWHRSNRHASSGRVGCFESHLGVYRAALSRGAPWALVFEDDVTFAEQAPQLLQYLDEVLASLPKTWKTVSVHATGSFYVFPEASAPSGKPHVAFESAARREGYAFIRGYAISESAMRRMIEVSVTTEHVDFCIARNFWGETYRLRHSITKDAPFTSDNDNWGNPVLNVLQSSQAWSPIILELSQAFLLHVLPVLLGDEWTYAWAHAYANGAYV